MQQRRIVPPAHEFVRPIRYELDSCTDLSPKPHHLNNPIEKTRRERERDTHTIMFYPHPHHLPPRRRYIHNPNTTRIRTKPQCLPVTAQRELTDSTQRKIINISFAISVNVPRSKHPHRLLPALKSRERQKVLRPFSEYPYRIRTPCECKSLEGVQ
jgi:hypothetical protein